MESRQDNFFSVPENLLGGKMDMGLSHAFAVALDIMGEMPGPNFSLPRYQLVTTGCADATTLSATFHFIDADTLPIPDTNAYLIV